MGKSDEGRRFKWSSLATNLLVSIWSHDLVQTHLRISFRNRPVWESIARYMTRRGFPVTGLQCKTRIRNMSYTYQEAKRKKDPSAFKPYFNIFENVLNGKSIRKTELKPIETTKLEDSNNDGNFVSNSREVPVPSQLEGPDCLSHPATVDGRVREEEDSKEVKQSVPDNEENCEYEIEFFDVSNQEPESFSSDNMYNVIHQLESTVVKAIDSQTKVITTAIKMQSQMIEKIIKTEKERLELVLTSERENTKNLENKLNELLRKFETEGLHEITFIGPLIENSNINRTSNQVFEQ